MKEQLLSNLNGVVDYIKQGADFVIAQAPLYVQEFLKYRYALHIFGTIICILGIITSLIIGYKVHKLVTTDDSYYPVYTLPGLLFCFSFGFFCSNVLMLLKIYFAPRVYIVENLLSIFNR